MIESATGKDSITGEVLPNWVRAVNFAFSAHGCAKLSWKLTKAGIRTTAKIEVANCHGSNYAGCDFCRHQRQSAGRYNALNKKRRGDGSVSPEVSSPQRELEEVAQMLAVEVSEVKIKAVQNLKLLLSPEEIAAAEKKAAAEKGHPKD